MKTFLIWWLGFVCGWLACLVIWHRSLPKRQEIVRPDRDP